MGIEIERKFLVAGEGWRDGCTRSLHVRQGYLAAGDQATARVRLGGGRAWLTVKGRRAGVVRSEYEYEIPAGDAEAMLDQLCGGRLVEKTRYWVEHDGHTWEVDCFEGRNTGLIVAEIELARVDEPFARPAWLGEEVSDDRRYYNAWLAEHPYQEWA